MARDLPARLILSFLDFRTNFMLMEQLSRENIFSSKLFLTDQMQQQEYPLHAVLEKRFLQFTPYRTIYITEWATALTSILSQLQHRPYVIHTPFDGLAFLVLRKLCGSNYPVHIRLFVERHIMLYLFELIERLISNLGTGGISLNYDDYSVTATNIAIEFVSLCSMQNEIREYPLLSKEFVLFCYSGSQVEMQPYSEWIKKFELIKFRLTPKVRIDQID